MRQTLKNIGTRVGIVLTMILVIAVVLFVGALVLADNSFAVLYEATGLGLLFFLVGVVVVRYLQKSERIKKEFIAVASHRLRTPLTRIQWMVSSLAELVPVGEQRKLTDNMSETLKDLTVMVNRLLEASEAEKTSAFYTFFFEEGNIAIPIRQAVADYTLGAGQKDIELSVAIDDRLPRVVFDYDRIKVAASSLLENAIIYTPAGGKVEVSLHAEKDAVVYRVKDTGIGVPDEAKPFLFSKFFRAKEAVSIDRDRVGLGLFVAREIIRKHKGKIGAESAWHEKGSTFWFSLPVRK